VLGNAFTWNFDPNNRNAANGYDAIGAIEHEITEGGFGRVGGLGDQNNSWGPLDLFRYSAAGVRDYTDGRDGRAAFFSVDGQQMLTPFHNSASSGTFDGQDPGDWNIGGDSFGFGGKGVVGQLSSIDLRLLDILGWTPTGSTPSNVDDFRNSLTDTTHPFGSVAVNGSSTGNLEVAGDRDWFQIQLVAGTPYVMTVTGQQGGGGTLEDSYLRVHNSAGTLLTENDDIVLGVNRDSQLTFTPSLSGTYYLDIGAFNDGYAGTYRVSVAATVNDDYRNSLADTSHPLGSVAVNGSSTGRLEVTSDRDWFQVQLVAGATYVINLQGADAGAGTLSDPYLRLHDGAGTLLSESDDIILGINHDSQMTFTATTSGTYYLETGAFADSYTGTYRVSVAANDDFRNSLADTSHPFGSVAVNGTSTGTLEVAADRDWFQVQLVGGTNYTINLLGLDSGSGTLSDPYLRLHDSVGTQLLVSDDLQSGVNHDSQVIFTPSTTGTYYVEVGAFADLYTGSYRVSVIGNHAAVADDFNGDGKSDIAWRNDSGVAAIWNMNDGTTVSGHNLGVVPANWHVAGTGDFNADGRSDFVWSNDTGVTAIWDMTDYGTILHGNSLGTLPLNWSVAGVGDFNGDHMSDILWRNSAGTAAI
jgi:riboflavin synthase alpha subunit